MKRANVWKHFVEDLYVKPAPMNMLRGAVTLKVISQMCLCFEILVSLTYAGIFIVLESSAWFPMMALFTAEAGLAAIHLSDVYDKTTLGIVSSRFLFVVMT